MKIAIFAGGVGTRLWPLSRKNTPKQFEKIIGEKSTLQMAVKRLLPSFKPEDIYVSTGKRYKGFIETHVEGVPKENFIFEPEMRDVGPAVGLAMTIIGKDHPDTPVAILWSDHSVKKERRFREVLTWAEKLVKENSNSLILIGQRARFPNQNLGWIEMGDKIDEIRDTKIYSFKRIIYRPSLSDAEKFFHSRDHTWNPGYFVTTPRFILSQYKKFVPEMWESLQEIQEKMGTKDFERTLEKIYPTLEKISFDDAVLERVDPKHISVIAADLGWSDIGAWEALKEALEVSTSENVTRGKVMINDAADNLIFNQTDQLLVGIDLSQMIVINTDDVVLICHKNSIPKIKKIVESLSGTPNEHLT
jgi:mannose-1-phosphate guanylyltransferase